MNIEEILPPVTMPPVVYPGSLFHALNLGLHAVKHYAAGITFYPALNEMTANRYVASYQDDLGNRYTVTVEAK